MSGVKGKHCSAQMDNTRPCDFCVVKAGQFWSFHQRPAAHRQRLSQADSSCKSDARRSSSSILLHPGAGLPLYIPIHMPVIWYREDCGRARLQTRGTTEQQRYIRVPSIFILSQNSHRRQETSKLKWLQSSSHNRKWNEKKRTFDHHNFMFSSVKINLNHFDDLQ